MQKARLRFYCILCTTVKHFGAVVMKSLRSVSGREGFFLAVGVGDYVFACKSMFFFSVYSLLVPYPKLLQVKNDAVNIVKKMRRSCQDAFFFFSSLIVMD